MTADAVLETVNLSDTPSAVAGRIEREEAIQLLKGKKQRDSGGCRGGHGSPGQHQRVNAYNNPLAGLQGTPRSGDGAPGACAPMASLRTLPYSDDKVAY
jgi:hypothetical protein